MNKRRFFIGDIHGCARTFREMVTEKIGLKKEDELYCVGDYIDRGPDSKGVIDFILELRKNNYNVFTLRGNHEQMLLDAFNGGDALLLWNINGGGTTLESFEIDSLSEMSKRYQDFFQNTELFISSDDFIVVHAGLNFNTAHPLTDKQSMLWIRDFPVDYDYLAGRLLIHGHTPMPRDFILSQKIKSPLNLDAGCVYTGRGNMGSLVALDFERKQMIEVPNVDQ
ncbi:MAG: metallophosphoesterase family protein [Bacteroidota bacterium]